MGNRIEVTVLIRATWKPDLTGDVEYPTVMHDFADRLREQFEADPLGALGKLPDPRIDTITVEVT